MYGLAEAGVGPRGGAGQAGSERHDVDVDVTVTIPAWSQVNEDKRVAALVESVWLGWGQAVVTLIKMAIGITAWACLLWVRWTSSWGAYHPVVILAAWGTAIYWVFSMAPLIMPLPTPPAPHGPFTMVAKPPPGCEVKVERVYLIVNPVSGGGRAMAIVDATVLPAFAAAGVAVDVRHTRRARDAYELTRTLALDGGHDAFVVVGGDGTIHEAINGMMVRDDNRKLPIGVIPAGTGNSLMMDFMAEDLVNEPANAVAAIIGGLAPHIDLNKVTFGKDPRNQTLYSSNLVGFSSDQCAQAVNIEDWNSLLGTARYDVCALWGLLKGRQADVVLTVDDEVLSTKVSTIFVTQTQHIGRGLRGSPAAVWDDGECNVCAIEHEPVAEQLRVLNGLKSNGAHFNFAEVQRQGRHVTLDFKSHEGLFNIDGQVARFEGGKIEIECIHNAIRFLAHRSALCTL